MPMHMYGGRFSSNTEFQTHASDRDYAPMSIKGLEKQYAYAAQRYNETRAAVGRELTAARIRREAVVAWLGRNAVPALLDYETLREAREQGDAKKIQAALNTCGERTELVQGFFDNPANQDLAGIFNAAMREGKSPADYILPDFVRVSTISRHGGGNRDARKRQLLREIAQLVLDETHDYLNIHSMAVTLNNAVDSAVKEKIARLSLMAAHRYELVQAVKNNDTDAVRRHVGKIHTANGREMTINILNLRGRDGVSLLAAAVQKGNFMTNAILIPFPAASCAGILDDARKKETDTALSRLLRDAAESWLPERMKQKACDLKREKYEMIDLYKQGARKYRGPLFWY